MTTMTLYEIRELRDLLDEALAATEGELSPEAEAQLAALDIAANEKIESVALYIREQLAQAEAIEAEAKRLQDRARARLNAAKSLKDYLAREMERLGKDKMNGVLVTVAMQNNPPSVKGDLEPATLAEMMDTAPTFVRYAPASYALDRRAVLDAYKRGETIPEGLTIEQTKSLRIR